MIVLPSLPVTCLAIVACVVAVAPAAQAAPGGAKAKEARAEVEAYLGSHDVAAVADLRKLSPSPERPLMAIALDARGDGLVRARAVAALRLLPSPEVQGFLGKLLADKAKSGDSTDRLLLRRGAIALGWMSGPRAETRLALLFENQDPEVRLDAAIGLGLTRSAEAPRLLEKQLEVEAVPRVRAQIEKQLKTLAQKPAEPEPPARQPEQVPMRGGF
jgi:HEAT repeat protein